MVLPSRVKTTGIYDCAPRAQPSECPAVQLPQGATVILGPLAR